MGPAHARHRLLESIGLHRGELRAWALYDPASAAAFDVVVTAVFPIYYASVVARGQSSAGATGRFAALTTAAMCCFALLAPALGAVADARRVRKHMLAVFVAIGAPAVAALYVVRAGDVALASVLFLVANVGLQGAALFHGALLPHVARDDELDRTSTAACALGYATAGLVLLAVFAAFQRPEWFGLPGGPWPTPEAEALPARTAFLVVAALWVALSIPLLTTVAEAPQDGVLHRAAMRGTAARIAESFRTVREHPQAFRFAVAALLYGSGVGTVVRMAVIYGAEIGIENGALLVAIVVVDMVGTPFALAFGALASRVGAKRALLVGLGGYGVATILAYFIHSTFQFFALALLIAAVQGGTQALSRSLFASMLPPGRSAEFFGFLALSSNFTGMIGPALFATVAMATGSSRSAILSVVIFFAAGAALLATVDVAAGQRAAQGTSPAGAAALKA